MHKDINVYSIIKADAIDLFFIDAIVKEIQLYQCDDICLDFSDVGTTLPIFVARILDAFPEEIITVKGVNQFTARLLRLRYGDIICEN